MFKNITTVSFLVLFILLHAWTGAASGQKLLEDIRFDTLSETEERISFQLNGAYIPKIFAIKGERPRVVFDFPDIRPARLLKNRFNTNGKFIKRIRVGIHYKPDAKTRVVFDLMPDREVDFKQDFDKRNNTLIITVYHAGSKPADRPEVLEPKKEIPPEPPVQAEEKTQAPAVSEKAVADHQLPAVKEQTTPAPAALPIPDQTTAKPVQPVEQVQPEPDQPEQVQPKPAQPEQVQAKPLKVQAQEMPPEPSPESPPESLPVAPATVEQPPTVIPSSPDLPAEGRTILSSITFDNSTNRGEMVLFQLNEFHAPIVFGVEEGEPRIVCDFKNTAAGEKLPGMIKTEGKYVRSIRIGLETTPQKVRVVLDLAPDYRYDLQQVFFKDNNTFAVIINTLHNREKPKEPNKPGE